MGCTNVHCGGFDSCNTNSSHNTEMKQPMTTEQKLDYIVAEVGTIKINLAVLQQKVDENRSNLACVRHQDVLDDHENRIRDLAEDNFKIKGAVGTTKLFMGVILFLLSVILGLITKQYLI